MQWFAIWIFCVATDLDLGFVGEGSKKMPELVSMVERETVDTTTIKAGQEEWPVTVRGWRYDKFGMS